MNEFEYDMFIDGIENAHDDAELINTMELSTDDFDGNPGSDVPF
jgi:hypothetical protein